MQGIIKEVLVQGQERQGRIKIVPLSELMSKDNTGEDIQHLRTLLSSYSCKLDKDIEVFLHDRAIDFECISKTRTYLLCDNNFLCAEGKFVILGYFSIALSVLDIPENVSNRTRKKLDGLSAKKHGNIINSIPCYLIGQLAKNSTIPKELSISGTELLYHAFSVIRSAESIIGGRCILIECHNDPKLIKFYEDNNFEIFENIPFDNAPMVQMLRPLCSTTL